MKFRPLIALTLAATALLAAGCGDDDETTTASTAVSGATGVSGDALTKEQFITEADKICSDGDREISQAAQAQFGSEQPQEDELTAFAEDVVLPATQAQYDAIAALPVPEGEEENIDEILSALDDGINELEQDPSSINDQGNDALAEASKLAQEFGFKDCGGG